MRRIENLRQHRRPRDYVASIPFERLSWTSCAAYPKMKILSGADMLADFHVGAIKRPMVSAPLSNEFQIARARRLHAGGRDLLGQVRRRDDRLARGPH